MEKGRDAICRSRGKEVWNKVARESEEAYKVSHLLSFRAAWLSLFLLCIRISTDFFVSGLRFYRFLRFFRLIRFYDSFLFLLYHQEAPVTLFLSLFLFPCIQRLVSYFRGLNHPWNGIIYTTELNSLVGAGACKTGSPISSYLSSYFFLGLSFRFGDVATFFYAALFFLRITIFSMQREWCYRANSNIHFFQNFLQLNSKFTTYFSMGEIH